MASNLEKTTNAFERINKAQSISSIAEKIKLKKDIEITGKSRLKVDLEVNAEGIASRLDFLQEETGIAPDFLSGKKLLNDFSVMEGNIENYIGMSQVPTGIMGPVKVLGTHAEGDFYVPLATSEGALVASYHRGAKACYLAGGATSVCLVEGVQRSPLFKFEHIGELGLFLAWVLNNIDEYKRITSESSRFAQLLDIRSNIEGNHLILTFEFHTGDASGQNMVTICTDAICQYIIKNVPVKPKMWFIEGNYSGDKKATALSFTTVRGKKVTTEVKLSEKIVNEVLKTTPKAMHEYWRSSTIGVIQSGAVGAQGHYANGLTALFIATGQDAACVAEAATGITRMELCDDGSLYAAVTLPNLIVGTVGGGTSLPTQRECLELMGCYGAGKARKFAEICGAVVLAGELSIAAALSAGHFASAHQNLGRKKK
ncbi:MAG: 3-hydroxy-3-methylglutaryl-CoA reductase [Crocinitomicaceae bacterium]|jgi:hydroxymethylglutaryl-CoA reductase (NADPH)|nr:3-hydroxy-3-methylglutaryl-CoA reductase [Crocinitomicaceae bacterium]